MWLLLCVSAPAQVAAPPATPPATPPAPQAPAPERAIRFEAGRLEELKKPVAVPRGYAVVIGAGQFPYLPADKQLAFAESDARAVAQTLLSKEGGQIQPENMKILVGAAATRANIENAVEKWLPTVAEPDDRVIVYFAGHGIVTPHGGMLVPQDFRLDKALETGYSMKQLGDVLATRVKAKWKVLLTDACHSGQITPQSDDAAIYASLSGLPRGFLTFTSSRQQEKSHEDAKLATGFGLFSYYLTLGWSGEADREPEDGKVTAYELIQYVSREVREHGRRLGVRQTPRDHGDFSDDMILGYSPTRRSKAIAAAGVELPNGELAIEANLDDVEIYVDEKLWGKVKAGQSLSVPGLSPEKTHVVKGVRSGYEPAVREVVVVPGEKQTVTLRLIYLVKTKPAAQKLYDEGYELYRRKSSEADWRKAETALAAAVKEDGNFALAWLQLCRVRQNLGIVTQALPACRKAVQLAPERYNARTQYGALLIESGDTGEAVRQLSEAARQDPKDPFVHSLLSEAYLLAGAYGEAEQAAVRSLEANPLHAFGYFAHGEALRYQKKWTEANQDYRRYLELADFHARAPELLAYYFVGFGASKRNAGFKRQHRVQQSSAYFGLCVAEFELENFARAVEGCRKATALDPQDGYAFNMMGLAYMSLYNRDNRNGDLKAAAGALRSALALAPGAEFAGRAKTNLQAVQELMAHAR